MNCDLIFFHIDSNSIEIVKDISGENVFNDNLKPCLELKREQI